MYVRTKFNFDRTAYSYREERIYFYYFYYSMFAQQKKNGESFAEWSFHEFMILNNYISYVRFFTLFSTFTEQKKPSYSDTNATDIKPLNGYM